MSGQDQLAGDARVLQLRIRRILDLEWQLTNTLSLYIYSLGVNVPPLS